MTDAGVVIATRNRVDSLLRTIDELRRLPEEPEIVVVDNASTDGTASLVKACFPAVRVIALDMNMGAAARNLGCLALRQPYIAFCDDDSWWQAGSLARAVELLERYPRAGLLAGRVYVGAARRLDPTCIAMQRSPLPTPGDSPGPCILGFLAAGSVVRRRAFLEAGGFHGRFLVGGEEELLAIDMASCGWQLHYVDQLVAFHHPSAMRDAGTRRRCQQRNALWVAWMRRRLPSAMGATVLAGRRALRDAFARQGLADALAGLSWVLKERRPVAGDIEGALRRLQAAR